jgi:predicted DNA-binding transcriptional regulator AlpA
MASIEPIALPIPEAANFIGVKRSKFYDLWKNGEVVIVKIGGKSVAPIEPLKAFIRAKTVAALAKFGEAA